jgi:hypothetical protein
MCLLIGKRQNEIKKRGEEGKRRREERTLFML